MRRAQIDVSVGSSVSRIGRWLWVLAALASTPCAPVAIAATADAPPKSAPVAKDPAQAASSAPSAGDAAKADAPSSADAGSTSVTATRAAVLPDETLRSRDYPLTLDRDESIWLEAGTDRTLALFRPVMRGETRGVVVIVLGEGLGPESASTSVALRHTLPHHGWATLLVRLPDATEAALSADGEAARRVAIRARLDAAVTVARQRAGDGAVIAFGEADAAAWTIWAQRNGLAAKAIVAVDVDAKTPMIESARPPEHLKAVNGPALVLIEAPREWSPDDPLSAETELHLLPADNPSSARVERVLRGWLKRRLS